MTKLSDSRYRDSYEALAALDAEEQRQQDALLKFYERERPVHVNVAYALTLIAVAVGLWLYLAWVWSYSP